jgi:hypothetical protein
MEPEESVLERLIGIPESYAALEGRIWLHKREQSSAYPCARVGLVTDSSRYHLRGGSNTGTAFVQVDVWAEEAGASDPYASAAGAAAVINAVLSGKQWRSAGLRITGAFRRARRAGYDPDELRLVRISQDFEVWFRRT